MITNISVSSLEKNLTYGIKNKEEDYKGYKLISNLMHCGVGGKYWITTVLDQRCKTLDSFVNETFIETQKEAMEFVDQHIINK